MKALSSLFAVGLVVCAVAFSVAKDDSKKSPLEGVKCLIAGDNDAKESKFVEYKEGKVYFCCDNCVKKFSDDNSKYEAKANHQLVKTGQYEQGACPFSGGGLNKDASIEVGGVKVSFCCNNCKGKAEKMEGDKQIAELFGKNAFEKGKFAKVEKKDDK